MNLDLNNEIEQYVKDADLVLVGIGWEFKAVSSDEAFNNKLKKAYNNLFDLINKKNHFIISLCYDDVIRECCNDDENIVTPCGTSLVLQCDEHLVNKADALIQGDKLICPKCGKVLVPNNIEANGYIEEGYLPDFDRYKKWLQGTVNKKLCIIELGAGMQFPTIIRFAFDKLCMYNLKSKFVRIHETLSQHTAENEGRTLSVNQNSVDFMSNFY